MVSGPEPLLVFTKGLLFVFLFLLLVLCGSFHKTLLWPFLGNWWNPWCEGDDFQRRTCRRAGGWAGTFVAAESRDWQIPNAGFWWPFLLNWGFGAWMPRGSCRVKHSTALLHKDVNSEHTLDINLTPTAKVFCGIGKWCGPLSVQSY